MGFCSINFLIFYTALCLSLYKVAALKCSPGTFLYPVLHSGQEFCIECPDETFISYSNHRQTACIPCENIREPELEILVSPCNITHNTVIHCVDGYYRDEARNPRETGMCRKCTQCKFPGQPCSTYSDTLCCHGENYDVVYYHGVPECKERPWFCRQGQYFDTRGYYCLPCPDNTYMPLDYHIEPECWKCRDYHKYDSYRPLHSVIIQPCNSTHAPVIGCEDGFYRNPNMGYREDAIGCRQCTDCSTKADVQYEGRRCNIADDTVCCPQAKMTVHDTPGGLVCMASSTHSACDKNKCFLYHIRNATSTCAPCFYNADVGEVDRNPEASTSFPDDITQTTVLPKKTGDLITTAESDVGFSFGQFLLGLFTGMIINMFIIIAIVFRSKYLKKYFFRTWIGRYIRSLTNRCIGLHRNDREDLADLALQPLRTATTRVGLQERWAVRVPRPIIVSDYSELEHSFGNELELEAKKETCPRRFYHENLFGVEDFAIDKMPPDFRDQRYLAYIKATSNLTVRLRVYHISEDRPENDPYYKLRGLVGIGLRRYGNGLVYQVSNTFDDHSNRKCPCKDCQSVFPENAKTNWAEFLVLTSAQIVFDVTECGQTSCKLWNGKDENPGKIPSLKGWRVKKIDREKDFCIMGCISHDPTVIKELRERVDNFNRLYARNKQAPIDTDDVNKLAVLIAHPHGLSKKMFLRKANAERGQARKWTYDDYTCPGSVGAPVCLLSNKKDSKILITIYNGNRESRGFELDDDMSATALDHDDTV